MSRYFLILAFVLIACVSWQQRIFAKDQRSQNNPGDSDATPPDAGPKLTDSNNFVAPIAAPDRHEHGQNEQEDPNYKLQERQTVAIERTNIGTWVGSISMSVSVIFLIWTLYETRRQANALIQSNKDARETHDAERRPWVSVDASQVNYIFTEEGNNVTNLFRANLKNHGVSPAFNVQYKFQLAVITPTASDDEILSKIEFEEIEDSIADVIFPDEEWYFTEWMSLPKQQAGPASLIFFGTIQYKSVTGTLHKTRFAYQLGAVGHTAGQGYIQNTPDWWRNEIALLEVAMIAD